MFFVNLPTDFINSETYVLRLLAVVFFCIFAVFYSHKEMKTKQHLPDVTHVQAKREYESE